MTVLNKHIEHRRSSYKLNERYKESFLERRLGWISWKWRIQTEVS
jgi:hypothetical protein